MMKEAESHADDDRKRKEEIETRNHADQAAYAAERMLKDNGDRLSASDRQPIEKAIEDLKRAVEKNDLADMKRSMDALNTAQHKAAETLYKTASGGAGATGGSTGDASGAAGAGQSGTGDVIDAEVVEEEKK
jgi:molecular chaperone DnaK